VREVVFPQADRHTLTLLEGRAFFREQTRSSLFFYNSNLCSLLVIFCAYFAHFYWKKSFLCFENLGLNTVHQLCTFLHILHENKKGILFGQISGQSTSLQVGAFLHIFWEEKGHESLFFCLANPSANHTTKSKRLTLHFYCLFTLSHICVYFSLLKRELCAATYQSRQTPT